MQKLTIAILAMLLLVLVGCDTTAPASVATPAPGATSPASAAPQGGYPAPQGAYPAPALQGDPAYPAPVLREGPKFTIKAPVRAADSQVSGTGPAGVPIRLVNITQSGAGISQTIIKEDGTFAFDVAGKLTSGERIALMLGDLQGTNLSQNDFTSGPGYQDFPMIGVLFDTTLIE